jgi:hypothetical protein
LIELWNMAVLANAVAAGNRLHDSLRRSICVQCTKRLDSVQQSD